jgi:hypothetical protein
VAARRTFCLEIQGADARTRTGDPFITNIARDVQSLAFGRDKPVVAGQHEARPTERLVVAWRWLCCHGVAT